MNVLRNVGILSHAQVEPIYIISDGLFVLRGSPNRQLRKISSLAAWYKALYQKRRTGSLGYVGFDIRFRIAQLEFLTCSLIPYLSFLATNNNTSLTSIAEVEELLPKMIKQTECLENHLPHSIGTGLSTCRLQKIFGVPCAVIRGDVVSLEQIEASSTGGQTVSMLGKHYRLRFDKRRSLSGVVARVDVETNSLLSRETSDLKAQTLLVTELARGTQTIINRLKVTTLRCCDVIYSDQLHQLYHARGHFLLARGPLTKRDQCVRIHVGLPINGKTRNQYLMANPRVTARSQDFWTPAGALQERGNLCMGRREQYRRLLSTDLFSDAEAVVQWLDAGVILATGKSIFHSRCRKSRRMLKRSIPNTTLTMRRQPKLWKSPDLSFTLNQRH
jgi:hypothetical protein